MRLGTTEIIILLVIVLLLFGAKKIPQLAEGLGKGIRNFKKGIAESEEPGAPASPRSREPERLASGDAPPVDEPRARAEGERR